MNIFEKTDFNHLLTEIVAWSIGLGVLIFLLLRFLSREQVPTEQLTLTCILMFSILIHIIKGAIRITELVHNINKS